jgi:uracil phosphoribosyltransferase
MKLAIFGLLLSIATAFAEPQALSQLVYEIRNPETGSASFREAIEKIGTILAQDLLEELDTKEVVLQTLTGTEAKHLLVNETPVLVTILRAGLPLNAGVHQVFPDAEVGFLAMSRDEETLKAQTDYVALPDLRGKTVILTDTMLATGGSLLDAIEIINQKGARRIFVVAAIASKCGIERITNYDCNIKIFAAVIDPFLNEKGYILPGLGDAGDRAYGKKNSE